MPELPNDEIPECPGLGVDPLYRNLQVVCHVKNDLPEGWPGKARNFRVEGNKIISDGQEFERPVGWG